MASKYDLEVEVLRKRGGCPPLIEICRVIWRDHEAELRASGDLLDTWRYNVRWAEHRLGRQGRLRAADEFPRGIWVQAR